MVDKFGFLWFGTRSGLNKFDGYNFSVYQFNPRDTNSLSDNWVNCISKSSNGEILVGTRYGGITRFNSVTNKIIRYQHSIRNKNSLSSNTVNCLLETKDGTLWAGTEEGLNYAVLNSDKFNILQNPLDPEFLKAKITSLYYDKKGSLWIGAYLNELTEYHIQEGKLTRYADPVISTEKYHVNRIGEFASGILMLGTERGLRFFDTYTLRFVNGLIDYSGADSLLKFDVKDFCRDNLGRIWCSFQTPGSVGILACIDPHTKKISYIVSDGTSPDQLSLEKIRAVYKDNSGVIWIGFDDKGLNYFHPSAQKFLQLTKNEGSFGKASSENIFSIHEGDDGSLWLGTSDKGVNHYYPKTGKNEVLTGEIFKNNYCSDIEPGDNGQLWFALAGSEEEGGAILYDPTKKTYKTFDEVTGIKKPLGSYRVSIIKNEKKYIWFGTIGAGLCRYEKATGKIIRFNHHVQDKNSLPGNEISTLLRDNKGRLWVGTRNGLSKLDETPQRFTNFTYQSENSNSLSSNSVLCLHEDAKKNLWIGTAHGLNLFNSTTNTFELISTENNLPDNHINGILEDERGDLWLSTNNGICRYSPKNKIVRSYSIGDGLQSLEFNTNSFLLGKKGYMYFGGISGVNIFHPDSISDNPFMPSVKITSVAIFGKQIPLDSGVFEIGRAHV